MDISSLYRELTEVAIPVGSGAAMFLATLWTQFGWLNKRLSNGNGKSIRQAVDSIRDAVDDLAHSFAEHRHEMKGEVRDIKERLSTLEDRKDAAWK